jgi:hypothetical protein
MVGATWHIREGVDLRAFGVCVSRRPMSEGLPPRLLRALELAYAVEGVVAARVWQVPGGVAVGARGGAFASPTDVLRRVELSVAGLREPGEIWEFGILDDVRS